MAGLVGIGRNTLSQASGGFQTVAGLEAQRNATNKQLAAARNAQRSSMAATGAGIGASIGVNKLMANKAAETAAQKLGSKIGIEGVRELAAQEALSSATITPVTQIAPVSSELAGMPALNLPGIAAAPAAEGVAAGTAAGATAGTAAGATAGTAATTGTVVGTATAAPAAAAPVAASTGPLAAIGTVATPLLIGAGAALLLDSLFDIF